MRRARVCRAAAAAARAPRVRLCARGSARGVLDAVPLAFVMSRRVQNIRFPDVGLRCSPRLSRGMSNHATHLVGERAVHLIAKVQVRRRPVVRVCAKGGSGRAPRGGERGGGAGVNRQRGAGGRCGGRQRSGHAPLHAPAPTHPSLPPAAWVVARALACTRTTHEVGRRPHTRMHRPRPHAHMHMHMHKPFTQAARSQAKSPPMYTRSGAAPIMRSSTIDVLLVCPGSM